jgi:hypothetical protein
MINQKKRQHQNKNQMKLLLALGALTLMSACQTSHPAGNAKPTPAPTPNPVYQRARQRSAVFGTLDKASLPVAVGNSVFSI